VSGFVKKERPEALISIKPRSFGSLSNMEMSDVFRATVEYVEKLTPAAVKEDMKKSQSRIPKNIVINTFANVPDARMEGRN